MYNLYIKYKHDYKALSNANAQAGGGHRKWETLTHNGVMFHPLYEPHKIPIKYNGEKIVLTPELEEYITYYVHPRYDKYRNDKFAKNFFKTWKTLFPSELKNKIKDFNLVDATDITHYILRDIEKRKELNKLKTKEQKDAEKSKTLAYKYAVVDGKQQEIDNFIVEPPTIFIGRGSHPLIGSIKYRINPEDVTLNIGKHTDIPRPSINGDTRTHKWKEIIHDNTLEWIASWQNNVTLKTNYARFGRKSIFKMKSDEKKYDLARKLKVHITKIRQKNTENLRAQDEALAQLATALYFIDTLALRAGNEKRTDEADTTGVTTLKVKNLTLQENNQIKLDFLGKDSVRYTNKITVPDQVYTNLLHFMEKKDKNDALFDRINSDQLNNYLKSFMKGLTSKVFRTYNASHLMQIELKKIINQLNSCACPDILQQAKYLYNMANLKVAKLCNHQKILSQNASASLTKINKQIKELKHKSSKTDNQKKRLIVLKNKKKLASVSKTLAAGTSKINYIDPRITVAFLKLLGLFDQISAFFNESQRKQFAWAMPVDKTFTF